MKLRRALVTVTTTAVLPFALTACSSGDAGGKSAPSASPKAGAPKADLLNGTRLKSLLLPVGVLPKGYHADPQATRDTGKALQAPASSKALDLAGACPKLEASAWIETSGVPSASFAQADFVNASQEEFNEEVDSYRGTDAQTVMKRLEKVLTHCASFKDTSNGTTASVKVKTTTVPKVGDQTLKAVLSAPEWEGGTTLVATRVGNVVITTFYNVQSSDMGAAGLDLTKKIAAGVQHAK
ncbi:hypothetical protein [Streptomyces chattanoogensis]|uniref:hypothetical protein n=1 Tax=Streptomyces chattanoogensis TaxID=66876 RepID=UPI0005D8692B|nr:hypothetical protein T261_0224 [Streptomyces lydicus]